MGDTMEFRVYALDVWGNSEDGYEVNDCIATDNIIELSDDWTPKDIAEQIMEDRTIRLSIEGDEDFTLYVDREEDGRPLVELRRLH
jgi:hypothetical protein